MVQVRVESSNVNETNAISATKTEVVIPHSHHTNKTTMCQRTTQGGKEEGREGEGEGGKEGGRQGGEAGRQGWRQGGREERTDEGREERRERWSDGGSARGRGRERGSKEMYEGEPKQKLPAEKRSPVADPVATITRRGRVSVLPTRMAS